MTKNTRIAKYSLKLVKESNSTYEVDKLMNSPLRVAAIFNQVFSMNELTEEIFCIACLDTKNKIIGTFEVSRGSLSASVVHPREVFKRAILLNSASIILCHNHPSGDTQPSKEDEQVTKRLVEGGKLLGIKVLDHIIVGDDYFSFRESDMI